MKILARVRLLSVEVVEVEVDEQATEAKIAAALGTTAEQHAECLGLDLLDAEWIADPLFQLGRSTVPEDGWVEIGERRWATDGQLMVRDDAPPLPRRRHRQWWRKAHPDFTAEKLARFLLTRKETSERCPPGMHLAYGADPDRIAADVGERADRLRKLGEVRYRSVPEGHPCAFIYPSGDDLPIAVIALCLDQIPERP